MKGGTLLKVTDFGNACNLKTLMTLEKGRYTISRIL